MGVGPYGVQAATAPTFSQIWNGRAWQPQAAVPSPLRSYSLASVSCPSSKSCLAVGGSLGRPQLSDAWNGRTWRELPVPAGSGDSELAGVACPSAQRCVAVGDAAGGAWAQLWNGASWSKLTPVAPAGSATSAFTAISCPGPADCTAVGDYATGPRSQRVDHALAESWNGSSWSVLPAPPSELTGLTAISCPTSAECVVAGIRTDRQVPTGSAVWNGSTWTSLTTQSPAKKPLGQILTSISCVSATDCIAVGSGPGPYDFGLGTGPFAERWTGGSSWQLLAMPDPVNIVFAPGGGRQSASGLNAISCTGPASCIAVGGAGDTQALTAYAGFAVSWNGQAWSVLRTGQVDGLMGASCGSVSHCLVTGTYLSPAGRTQALSETVDGKTVRLAAKSGPGGVLSAVSCVSSSFCLAAGEGRDIYRWNGSRWTTSSSGPVTFIDFTEVHISRMSCVSKSFCMAAGRPTFAEFWNGRKWRVRPLVTHPGNQVETILGGLSCTKPTFCLAVGEWFEATSDKGGTLAEVWNGKGWRIIHAPGGQTDNFNAVSCVKSTDCMVIGSDAPPGNGPVHLIAERWNGRTWQPSHPPGSFGSSCGVAAALARPTFPARRRPVAWPSAVTGGSRPGSTSRCPGTVTPGAVSRSPVLAASRRCPAPRPASAWPSASLASARLPRRGTAAPGG